MKKKVSILLIFSLILIPNVFPINFSTYSPIEYEDFIGIIKATDNNTPGMSFFGKKTLRVHAILHEFPKEIDNVDTNNIRYTLRSLGLHPDMADEFGYKFEYIIQSNVSWQEETRLVFYIQKVQRQYFENEYKLNDPIYWFIVFNQFNTHSQTGYFLVSDFINKEQFIKYGLK